ncbi:WD domain G-beta repeat [Carpediemonas membranifera]|uniref:WD domain G-beta repeat n=1 Tax=Carpediemonas membranifera TaxID=201153 RepID=A0A8J6B9R9_9EUKA|nr:WD domain G-beta repeat [Carpediemonas membranifera]|eukprot:KAG9397129.1 WD domain G-beta repeat [Carpediemonas membranifera]
MSLESIRRGLTMLSFQFQSFSGKWKLLFSFSGWVVAILTFLSSDFSNGTVYRSIIKPLKTWFGDASIALKCLFVIVGFIIVLLIILSICCCCVIRFILLRIIRRRTSASSQFRCLAAPNYAETAPPPCSLIVLRGRAFVDKFENGVGQVLRAGNQPEYALQEGENAKEKKGVTCVAFLPDSTMITGSKDGYVRLWNRDGHCLKTLCHPTGDECRLCLAVSHDGTIASGGNGKIILWTKKTDESWEYQSKQWKAHKRVNSLAFYDGKLFSGGYGRSTKVRVWVKSECREFNTSSNEINCVAISPCGKLIVASGSKKLLWAAIPDLTSPALYPVDMKSITLSNDPISCVAFSPDGKYLACPSQKGSSLVVLETPEDDITKTLEKCEAVFTLDDTRTITSVSFSPDSRTIAVAYVGEIELYDLTQHGNSLCTFKHPGNANSELNVAFSPDSSMLLSGSSYAANDAMVWPVYDINLPKLTQEALNTLTRHGFGQAIVHFEGSLYDAKRAFEAAKKLIVRPREFTVTVTGIVPVVTVTMLDSGKLFADQFNQDVDEWMQEMWNRSGIDIV